MTGNLLLLYKTVAKPSPEIDGRLCSSTQWQGTETK